jgi:hypothetical protein
VVLRLRSQVVELQTRVHRLEAELAIRRAGQDTHLVQYREACYEASWYEVVDNRTYAAILSRSSEGKGVWGPLRMSCRLSFRQVSLWSTRSRSTIK